MTLPEVDPGLDIFPAVAEFPSVLVDPELLARLWLASQFPSAVVQTETDETLAGQDWTIKVSAGGGAARFTLTTPRVTLDTFAPSRQLARTNALLADHAMRWLLPRSKLGYTSGGPVAVVSKVVQLSGPVHVPDPNTSLRHFAGVYAVTFSPLA